LIYYNQTIGEFYIRQKLFSKAAESFEQRLFSNDTSINERADLHKKLGYIHSVTNSSKNNEQKEELYNITKSFYHYTEAMQLGLYDTEIRRFFASHSSKSIFFFN
jgi:hypothetical protein